MLAVTTWILAAGALVDAQEPTVESTAKGGDGDDHCTECCIITTVENCENIPNTF